MPQKQNSIEDVIEWFSPEEGYETVKIRVFDDKLGSKTIHTEAIAEFDIAGTLFELSKGKYMIQIVGKDKSTMSKRFSVTEEEERTQNSVDMQLSKIVATTFKSQSDMLRFASTLMGNVFTTAVKGINETNVAMPKAMAAMSKSLLSISNINDTLSGELRKRDEEIAELKKKEGSVIPTELVDLVAAFTSKSEKNIKHVIDMLNSVPLPFLKTGMVKVKNSLSKDRVAVISSIFSGSSNSDSRTVLVTSYVKISDNVEERVLTLKGMVIEALNTDFPEVSNVLISDLMPEFDKAANAYAKKQEELDEDGK